MYNIKYKRKHIKGKFIKEEVLNFALEPVGHNELHYVL